MFLRDYFLAEPHTVSPWVSGERQEAACTALHALMWDRSILGTALKNQIHSKEHVLANRLSKQ